VKYYTNKARQAGMTLIELTVVLLVLVGLAGLMIPYVAGFVGKTHDATGSSNIQGLSTAIIRYETEKGRYPNNMDSLINASGDGIINYTMADMMGSDAATEYGFSVLTITANNTVQSAAAAVCGSLLKAGIESTASMQDSSVANFNATFNNASGERAMGMAMNNACMGTAKVIEVTEAAVEAALSRTLDGTNKKYIAFGVGQESELVGKTLTEAPVHFAKNADMNASMAYNRFIAIFEVDANADHTTKSATRATYLGSVMAMSKLVGLQTELGNYYADSAANN